MSLEQEFPTRGKQTHSDQFIKSVIEHRNAIASVQDLEQVPDIIEGSKLPPQYYGPSTFPNEPITIHEVKSKGSHIVFAAVADEAAAIAPIRLVSGKRVQALPNDTRVIAFLEGDEGSLGNIPDYDDLDEPPRILKPNGSNTTIEFPVAIESERLFTRLNSWKRYIDSLKNGSTNSRNKRKSAAEMSSSIFSSVDKDEIDRLLEEWKFAFTNGFEPYQKNGKAMRTISVEEQMRSILRWVANGTVINETVDEYIQIASPDDIEKSSFFNFLNQGLITLAIAAKIKYQPEYADMLLNIHQFHTAISFLETYAEKLIGRQILEDSGNSDIYYRSINKRQIPLIRAFIEGSTAGELVRKYRMLDTKSNRFSISKVLGQFSFGEFADTALITRAAFRSEVGEAKYSQCLDEFIANLPQLSDIYQRDKKRFPGYERLLKCRHFMNRWRQLSPSQRHDVINRITYKGGMEEVSKIYGITNTSVTTFFGCFERYMFDGQDIVDLYSNDGTYRSRINGGFTNEAEAASEFNGVLQYLRRNPALLQLLPSRAGPLLEFMGIYTHYIYGNTGEDKSSLRRKQALEERYRYHEWHTLLAQSTLFCDLVRRLQAFPRDQVMNNPIVDAWLILHLVDHSKKRLSSGNKK